MACNTYDKGLCVAHDVAVSKVKVCASIRARSEVL